VDTVTERISGFAGYAALANETVSSRDVQALAITRKEYIMTATREDVQLLLQLDEVYRPGLEARKFAYSSELAESIANGDFFDKYPLDSDERFFINEIGTYFEMIGLLWHKGLVDGELVLEWSAAGFYWKKVGGVLVKAREVFDAPTLWEYFEALAGAQMEP
jgi:hypothetical protein